VEQGKSRRTNDAVYIRIGPGHLRLVKIGKKDSGLSPF